MALGKSLREIRSLPNPEYQIWKLFYALEPFGWGAHHAMLYNINRGKGKAKNEDELLKARADEIINHLRESVVPDLSEMTPEERRAIILQQVKKDFRIK